jgi:hypothetical protein
VRSPHVHANGSNSELSETRVLILLLYDEGNLADDRDLKAHAMNDGVGIPDSYVEVDSFKNVGRCGQRGLVSAGFAPRIFLTSRLISRQVTSSVYVGEKVSDFTQPTPSSAGNVDQFLLSSSRVRCSLARQLVNLSPGVWLAAIEAAARQLAVTSQLGTPPSATATRVRRAEASVGQNEMPSAEMAAMAIISRCNIRILQNDFNLR